MAPPRFSYIDIGAGIMILWMIVGHAVYAASSVEISLYDLCSRIGEEFPADKVHAIVGKNGQLHPIGLSKLIPNCLFFFMPWFFYKSGQFFRKRGLIDAWRDDWKKLINKFILWSAFGYILYLIFQYIDGFLTLRTATYDVLYGLFFFGSVRLNSPLWFLLSLFIVRQIANMQLPDNEDRYYSLKNVIIIVACCLVAFCAYSLHWRYLPYTVANCALGLAFFTLGYWIHRYETKWWLFVPCLLVYIACCIFGFPEIDVRSNYCVNSKMYLLSLPACFAGIIVFNMFTRILSSRLRFISTPLESIGRSAMIIYVSHGLIFESVCRILPSMGITRLMTFNSALWIVLCAYVLLLPILCILSRKLVGAN